MIGTVSSHNDKGSSHLDLFAVSGVKSTYFVSFACITGIINRTNYQ